MRKHGLKARQRQALVERVINYRPGITVSLDLETEYEIYQAQQGIEPYSVCDCEEYE